MIDQKIRDFMKIYHNVLDADLCNDTVASLKESMGWAKHYYYNSVTDENTTYDDDFSMSWENIPQKQTVQDKLYGVLEKYIFEDMGYPWFGGWRGYSPVRFNQYSTNTKMNLHCDHIHSLFPGEVNGIPILSMVGGLNDDYEGGEFLMWDEVVEIPVGSVLVFPSNFLYPHLVNPVTEGTRFSYVSWAF